MYGKKKKNKSKDEITHLIMIVETATPSSSPTKLNFFFGKMKKKKKFLQRNFKGDKTKGRKQDSI